MILRLTATIAVRGLLRHPPLEPRPHRPTGTPFGVAVASTTMPDYLSDDWFAAASAAVAADRELQDVTTAEPIVVQQTVTAAEVEETSSVVWHVVLGPVGVRWEPGAHRCPHVTFTCDADTAWAVQSGAESAQGAFMAGRLRVGGDAGVLIEHQQVLGDLHDALGPLRASTTR